MNDEQQQHWEFARQLSREARANPDSPYAGKYVGVWEQRVVAIANDLDDALRQMSALGEEARDATWIEASADYERTYAIWSL